MIDELKKPTSNPTVLMTAIPPAAAVPERKLAGIAQNRESAVQTQAVVSVMVIGLGQRLPVQKAARASVIAAATMRKAADKRRSPHLSERWLTTYMITQVIA